MRRGFGVVGGAIALVIMLMALRGVTRPDAARALSYGCGNVVNNPVLDGSYNVRSVAVLSSLAAGEIITVTAGPPLGSDPSPPVMFSLFLSAVAVATQSIPGSITYVVPAATTITGVGVSTNGGANGGTATFDVSCKEPPSITYGATGLRGKLLVTGVAPLGVDDVACFDNRPGMVTAATPGNPYQLTLSYTGAGWHPLFCSMDTTSEGFVSAPAGMFVLGPPFMFQTALQVPAPGFSFGGVSGGSCETRPLILKNDGTQPYNINQMTIMGPHTGSFAILSGAGRGSIPVGGARIVTVRACSVVFQPLSAILVINGSAGTGAGVPAPLRIALSANTGDD